MVKTLNQWISCYAMVCYVILWINGLNQLILILFIKRNQIHHINQYLIRSNSIVYKFNQNLMLNTQNLFTILFWVDFYIFLVYNLIKIYYKYEKFHEFYQILCSKLISLLIKYFITASMFSSYPLYSNFYLSNSIQYFSFCHQHVSSLVIHCNHYYLMDFHGLIVVNCYKMDSTLTQNLL